MSLQLPYVQDRKVQRALDAISGSFPLTTQLLVDEVITVTKIADGAVIADKIDVDQLSAITANLGTVTAGKLEAVTIKGAIIEGTVVKGSTVEGGLIKGVTLEGNTLIGDTIEGATISGGMIEGAEIIGNLIRTATSGRRVEMDDEGLRFYDVGEVLKASLDTTTGIALVRAVLSSEDGSEIDAKHIDGQLTNAQIESIAAAKLTGTITETQIGDDAIATKHLQAAAVTTAEIAAGTIVAGDIAAETITGSLIAGSTINATKLNVSSLAAITVNAGKLTAGEIQASALSISTLSAITANLGSITAGTITGATFRSSGSNETVMDGNGVSVVASTSANPGAPQRVSFLKEAGGTRIGSFFTRNGETNAWSRSIVDAKSQSKALETYIALTASDNTEKALGEARIQVHANSLTLLNSNGASSFPKLTGSLADRSISFGTTAINIASQGGYLTNVAHNLGKTPTAVIATMLSGVFQTNVTTDSYTSTTFRIGAYRTDGPNVGSQTVAWIAIG